MRLRVRHLTRFDYEDLARDSFNDVRLCPITDSCQTLCSFNLRLSPQVPVFVYHDFYHNRVDHFEILHSHPYLSVESNTVVETLVDPRGPLPLDRSLAALAAPDFTENIFDFLTETHSVSLEAEVWRESVDVLPGGVQDLWERFYRDFSDRWQSR